MVKHNDGDRRLLILASYLDNLSFEDKRLDMSDWTEPCGTPACAIGHAGSIKALRQEGFYVGTVPMYKGSGGWTAVDEFFHLSRDESRYLFDQNSYNPETEDGYMYFSEVDPSIVARRIRKVVEAHNVIA